MGATATSEIKVVGKSGQISLGKRYAGKTLELQRLDDGTLLLRAVAMVPGDAGAGILWRGGLVSRLIQWARPVPDEGGCGLLQNGRTSTPCLHFLP